MTNEANDPPEGDEKKIIVDEDWKSRVQAEKEELKHKQEDAAPSKAGEAADTPESPRRPAAEGPLPPPSLEFLASTLSMQAMVAMGLLARPGDEKPEIYLDEARHFIDTIQMLQEKTEGNRTPEETATLESLLHDLRMGFVAVQAEAGKRG